MTRYQVYGVYTDPPQSVVDIVDAESGDQAEAIVTHARGGEHSDYICEGSQSLEDDLKAVQALMAESPEKVAADLAALAEDYAHYHEDEHPDTDEHRAGCVQCQFQHDKNQEDA